MKAENLKAENLKAVNMKAVNMKAVKIKAVNKFVILFWLTYFYIFSIRDHSSCLRVSINSVDIYLNS